MFTYIFQLETGERVADYIGDLGIPKPGETISMDFPKAAFTVLQCSVQQVEDGRDCVYLKVKTAVQKAEGPRMAE